MPNTLEIEEYTSHNTQQLTVKEVKEKLLKLSYIQEELKDWRQSR